MKKTLLFAVACMSLLSSGCVKESETSKKIKRVQSGIYIYTGAAAQNTIAMQQANIGLRFAMLAAEAKAQGLDIGDVKIGTMALQRILLGVATVTAVDGGYKITFDSGYADFDTYTRKGVVLINTRNTDVLQEATALTPWSVTFEDKLVLPSSSGELLTITLTGGSTDLYFDSATNQYVIDYMNQSAYVGIEDPERTANMNGRFTLTPENINFTYTDCVTKKFIINGEASGKTCYSYGQTSSSRMSIKMTNVEHYTPTRAVGGTVVARVIDAYDMSLFPSTEVLYQWSQDSSTGLITTTISYNGITESFK